MIKKCPYCKNKNIIKKGKSVINKKRYLCKDCNKYFQFKVVLPSWVRKAYNPFMIIGIFYPPIVEN